MGTELWGDPTMTGEQWRISLATPIETDLGHVGSVVVMLGFSCLVIYDVFLDQGANPCSLAVDS